MPIGPGVGENLRDIVAVKKPAGYVDGYQEFTTFTDEKTVLARAIGNALVPGSLLDIGAGTGDIPDALELSPADYLAVEQLPEFAAVLRAKGYEVIEDLFPCAEMPDRTFNNILMSYVFYDPTQTKAMLDPAWELLEEGGRLIAVTYGDRPDDYKDLMQRIGRARRNPDGRELDFMTDTFHQMGTVDAKVVTSHIFGGSLADVARALSFVATNNQFGNEKKRQEIVGEIMAEQELFDERYQVEDGSFVFPMDHYMFVVRKSLEVDTDGR